MGNRMQFGPCLKAICESRGLTRKVDRARFLGMAFQPADKIMQDWYNPSCDAMIRYLDQFGMELVVVQKGSKLPDGAVTLEKSRPKDECDG